MTSKLEANLQALNSKVDANARAMASDIQYLRAETQLLTAMYTTLDLTVELFLARALATHPEGATILEDMAKAAADPVSTLQEGTEGLLARDSSTASIATDLMSNLVTRVRERLARNKPAKMN